MSILVHIIKHISGSLNVTQVIQHDLNLERKRWNSASKKNQTFAHVSIK